MSPEDEDEHQKPSIVAKPISKDDEDSDKASTVKSAKPVDDEKVKEKDDKSTPEYRDSRFYGPPPQQAQYPPSYPPQAPLFSQQNVYKLLSLGILIGIILLFIGSLMNGAGTLVEPDSESNQDTKRNLHGWATIVDGIGLFIISIFILLPLLLIRDLENKQRTILIILIAAIIIGYTFIMSGLYLGY
jgi:hypothetical protein